MPGPEPAILLVDDEEALRLTFEMLLQRAGYADVVGVPGFDAACRVLKERPFDCIVSDIVLGGATGIDLLRHVKESKLTCPVIIITGYPNIQTAAEAVRLGAFDYLPKPVKKDALLDVVGRAVASCREQRQAAARVEEESRAEAACRQVLESVPELLLTLDADLRISEINEAVCRWGKACAVAISAGMMVDDLPEQLAAPLREAALRSRQSGDQVAGGSFGWVAATGQEHWFQLAAAPILSEGRWTGAMITLRHEEGVAPSGRLHGLIGASPAMQQLFAAIASVARSDANVLISGESGTGKELVAEALHRESGRSGRPLVKVDCTAIPDNLMESELFGHVRGAFTGALSARPGRILQADGGTLFLDEIGDISPRMQLRLLHFLQEQTFFPVGSDKPVRVNVRIVAATNADLKAKIAADEFREDLFFRLRVIDLVVPPLRDREGDIVLLARYFLRMYNQRFGRSITGLSDAVLEGFRKREWPGNVRELQHVMESAVVFCQGSTITAADMPGAVVARSGGRPLAPAAGGTGIPEGEADTIAGVLRATGGNKAKAARLLGMDRSTLYRKMQSLGLDSADIVQ
ncbi:MAG: sigma 54-interacting transcriptional regulator [Thermodesulfobacteriota bacterium]